MPMPTGFVPVLRPDAVGSGLVSLAITPSDTAGNGLPNFTRGLFVGGAGNLVVIDTQGNTTTFTNVQAGQILPIAVQQVKATGTTCTNIVGLY